MEYRIHLGDCLDVMRDMADASVDAVITDPPYSSGGQYRGDRVQSVVSKYVQTTSDQTCRQSFSGDNRDQRSFLIWCSLWMGEARRVTKPGGIIACFTDWRQLPTVTDAIQCGGWVWRGLATWWKPGVRMQKGRFSHSAEYIVYGSNGPVSEGEHSPQNVFACQPVAGEDKEHVAEKPGDVMRWVCGVVPAGGVVLDPFMGSGKTGLACMATGRPFVGIEIDGTNYRIADRLLSAAAAEPPLFARRETVAPLFGAEA